MSVAIATLSAAAARALAERQIAIEALPDLKTVRLVLKVNPRTGAVVNVFVQLDSESELRPDRG